MSYLQWDKATLPDTKKMIISFWVKTGRDIEFKQDLWNEEWLPKKITDEADLHTGGKGGPQVAFNGSSYWSIFPQFDPPHIFPYPPGPEPFWNHGLPQVGFKDWLVPFITFGDPNQKYKRIKWVTEPIREEPWFAFEPGFLGRKTIVSQHPEGTVGQKGGVEGTGQGTVTEEEGVVPPSLIGAYNGFDNRGLRIILQTKDRPQVLRGYAWAQTHSDQVDILVWMDPDPMHPFPIEGRPWVLKNVGRDGRTFPDSIPEPWMFGSSIWYTDVSLLECTQHPEAFIIDISAEIQDGEWHHILVSFDLEGKVEAEATGPEGDPPLPGPYGQFSGDGPGDETAVPREEVGKYGYADGGKLTSTCKAWVAIDDVNYTNNVESEGENQGEGGNLWHAGAVQELKKVAGDKGGGLLSALDPNAILTPNSLLAPFREIRYDMTTSLTKWERLYRTLIGGLHEELPCIIAATNEPRRLDYPYPHYEFTPGPLPLNGHPIGIPAGEKLVDLNMNIIMAELQIWVDKTIDTGDVSMRRLFITEKGEPASMKKAEDELGRPHVRIHTTGHWKKGCNTGSTGVRLSGSGPDVKRTILKEGQFRNVSDIDRYLPDPKLDKPPAPTPPTPTPTLLSTPVKEEEEV